MSAKEKMRKDPWRYWDEDIYSKEEDADIQRRRSNSAVFRTMRDGTARARGGYSPGRAVFGGSSASGVRR